MPYQPSAAEIEATQLMNPPPSFNAGRDWTQYRVILAPKRDTLIHFPGADRAAGQEVVVSQAWPIWIPPGGSVIAGFNESLHQANKQLAEMQARYPGEKFYKIWLIFREDQRWIQQWESENHVLLRACDLVKVRRYTSPWNATSWRNLFMLPFHVISKIFGGPNLIS